MTGVNGAIATARRAVNVVTARVTVSAGLTCKVKVAVTNAPLASVIRMVSTVDARAAVGVPEIAPVDALRVKPAGSVGEIVNTFEPKPPVAVTGINDATAFVSIAFLLANATVAANGKGVVMTKLNVLEAVPETASVIVTV